MKNKSQTPSAGSLTVCILILVILLSPTVQWLFPVLYDGRLDGYTPPVSGRPASLLTGFLDKTLQPWAEKYYTSRLGFRPFLVRSFNEFLFSVFGESASRTLFMGETNGLFNDQTITSLNNEIILKDQYSEKYAREADNLARASRMLRAMQKHLYVVIASSKGYIYPQALGERYIHGGVKDLFSRMASFSMALKAKGVQVYDTGPVLRDLVASTNLQTHPYSGVHWNFYVGCLIGEALVKNIEALGFAMPTKRCSGFEYTLGKNSTDTDAISLLNLWFENNLIKPSPFPKYSDDSHKQISRGKRARLLFIGDSFSDQIRESYKKTEPFSKIVFSSYFGTRVPEYPVAGDLPSLPNEENIDKIRRQLLDDIIMSDIIFLEMVDYNTYRLGYGFSEYLLNNQSFFGYKTTQPE